LQTLLERAAKHNGTSFVEIYQNCPIYNDNAFVQLSDKKTRPNYGLFLEHGKPMTFGPQQEFGIALNGLTPVVVPSNDARILIHDEENEMQALVLSRLTGPDMPTPLGVIRSVERASYDELVNAQVAAQRSGKVQTVQQLLEGGETWLVGSHE
jgi:2-oxoglutarate ferredoxin oxidoreductase subunit beta